MINHNAAHLTGLQEAAIRWAGEAGQIALRYFKNVSVQYKADNTLVTQADVEIEGFLEAQIHQSYPNHALISEEGARKQTGSPYTWVIDPLDGTTAFVQGLPGWGISIGLLYGGQPIFGLFYMPLLDDLTITSEAGVYVDGQLSDQRVRLNWGSKGFLATNSEAHHKFEIDIERTRALGGVVASLVYTARGSATAAFIPKARLWDLVAGACILKQAGGELRYLSGSPVEYTTLMDGSPIAEPIIAGHPDLLTELEAAIRPRERGKSKIRHE